MKQHIKRLNTPKTWNIKRKGICWITRPKPGAHPLKFGMSINSVLKEILKLTKTTKESKRIINNKNILIDGKIIKEHRFLVGFMDVISLPSIKKYYRIIFDKKGRLSLIEIDEKESKMKICKILNKHTLKGKIQINFTDSRNIIVDKNSYNTSDSLLITLPDQKIKDHIKFEKNSTIYLIGGKHIGIIGKVEEIKGNKFIFKTQKGETYETLKKYAFVIGKDKPIMKLE